jgi:tripeptide aminopeptidase
VLTTELSRGKVSLMTERLLSRFLKYVQVDTQSNPLSRTFPSTPGQLDLQHLLYDELKGLGAAEVTLTRHGYVLATIPPTVKQRNVPTVAFFAHVDTAPDFSGKGVKPRVHRKYNGQPIRFPDNPRLVLDPASDADLAQAKGKDVVTASGKTLLGADDKAGVAIVMALAEQLLQNLSIVHGPIRLCFTPDEEIGRGVDKLDLKELGAEVAYTLDGQGTGEIAWETFSGDSATVTIEGVSTHPGEAKTKGMVNALQLAARLLASLPREHCAPETTSGREGFIHPTAFEGSVERAEVRLILRDFELAGLAEKRGILQGLCRGLQAAELRARIVCKVRKQYRNMAYWLRNDMRPVHLAREAIIATGLKPIEQPVRGGTDGSRLTEMGLPTPNLFCGEHNAHGPLEWVAVQDMEQSLRTCLNLLQCWTGVGGRISRRLLPRR